MGSDRVRSPAPSATPTQATHAHTHTHARGHSQSQQPPLDYSIQAPAPGEGPRYIRVDPLPPAPPLQPILAMPAPAPVREPPPPAPAPQPVVHVLPVVYPPPPAPAPAPVKKEREPIPNTNMNPGPNQPTNPRTPKDKTPAQLDKYLWTKKPHPLLWVTLALSLVALVLGVPKGSLPTVTGRHKALRAQELAVQERLALLTQLASFLPPPLAALLDTPDLARLGPTLQLWNTQYRTDGRWWTLEELGAGATLVRAREHSNWWGVPCNGPACPSGCAGNACSLGGVGVGGVGVAAPASTCPTPDREVWVLRTGEGDAGVLAALTNSLLARERVYTELDRCRAHAHAQATAAAPTVGEAAPTAAYGKDKEDERRRQREEELEAREREVARREAWVVDQMRKLADKTHAQATELTLEDRITGRLKAYQRQLDKVRDA